MSSGERPIGAAKGKQSDPEALCQTPTLFQHSPGPAPVLVCNPPPPPPGGFERYRCQKYSAHMSPLSLGSLMHADVHDTSKGRH